MRLVDIATDGGSFRLWDIENRVGVNSPNMLIDVKFCQYMLYKVNRRLLLSDVIGKWGPKSTAALAGWENSATKLVRDGIIDVIPPGGNGSGTISKKVYKLVNMQAFYISDTLGIALQHSLIPSPATQEAVLRMPEDCADMPDDLRHDMVTVRDGMA